MTPDPRYAAPDLIAFAEALFLAAGLPQILPIPLRAIWSKPI